jgi:hypothetical protein
MLPRCLIGVQRACHVEETALRTLLERISARTDASAHIVT